MVSSMNWVDSPTGGTPISAANLNKLAVVADLGTPGSPTGNALRAAIGASVTPQVAGLDFALRNGLSTAVGWHGDSTGDSDGTNPADLRTPTQLAQLIAAKYPNFHVLSRHWNGSSEMFDPLVVLQSATGGQAYTNFGLRSVRYPSSLFASGNMDLRVKVQGSVTGSDQALMAQMVGDSIAYGSGMVFRFLLKGDGSLYLGLSNDGTSFTNWPSSAALPAGAVNGWLRCTTQITPGASGSQQVDFYTSPDNVTWTRLGATLGPYTGATSAMFSGTDTFFEIGAEEWQPAALPFQGKIYEVEIRDGINGPLLAPALPRLWERYPDTATTYGGAPTLTLVNASRSGSDLAYHMDAARLKKMTPDYGQVVAYFNDSENEVGKSGPTTWLAPFAQWVQAVQARLAQAVAVAVIQPPHTSAWLHEAEYGVSHVKRMAELVTYAGRQGWGFVDLFSAFSTDPRGLAALITDDGLHPSQVGYALAATTAARQLGL